MSLKSFTRAFNKAVTEKHLEVQSEVIQAHRATYINAKSERARQAALKKWDKAVDVLDSMETLRKVQENAQREHFFKHGPEDVREVAS